MTLGDNKNLLKHTDIHTQNMEDGPFLFTNTHTHTYGYKWHAIHVVRKSIQFIKWRSQYTGFFS